MEPTFNPILQTPLATPPTTIDVTITHSNGLISKHHYNIPNEANVELVCINNHQTTIYPLSHNTHAQSTNRSFHCPSSTRFNATGLTEAISRDSIPNASGNNQLIVSPSPGFSMMLLHPPTTEEVTKAPTNSPHHHHHDVKVTDASNECQGIGGPSAQPSEMVVIGPTYGRKRGHVPFTASRPLKKKSGPYTCKTCGEVFQISQAIAAHMRGHYMREETMVQKMLKRELRMRRKIEKEKLKAAESSKGPTILHQSSKGTKEVVAINVTVEGGESASKLNNTLDLGKEIKGT